MDSDGFPNNNLDHLFSIPMPKGINLAAPQGYWFSNEGVQSDFCQLVGKGQNLKELLKQSSVMHMINT